MRWSTPQRVGAGLLLLPLVAALLWGLTAWLAPLPERLGTPGSAMVLYADGQPAHIFLAPDERLRVPASLDEVDPAYVDALLRFEDKRFWFHPGVDPLAIVRAVWVNLTHGSVKTGASTITMQVVRMVEPRERTVWSKLIEAHRATTLELRLSKTEILEAYLTFAPFGGNVEGVEVASVGLFGHRPNGLSADEIAVLLAIPQRPTSRSAKAANQARLRQGRDEVIDFLAAVDALADGELTSAEVRDQVKAMPVPQRMAPPPRGIPHLAMWLRERQPDALRLRTTLDLATQQQAEQALQRVREERSRQGIHNAVVVVVDNESREVRALVGGFDFWDEAHGGQVLAFDTPRSPGSALKPFIYGLAIDRGLALPEFLVRDVPTNYGNYTPKNYDGRFAGLVQLEQALSKSLNLPFVFLLQDMGVEAFLGKLRAMDVRSLNNQPGYYGLSVAAGGIEVTPLELASAYVTLANDGQHAALRILASDPSEEEREVLGQGATWLTARALRLRDRPDFPDRWRVSDTPRDIAWKTGTSFGHRDAWAAGWNPEMTAVVWMGNVDNAPSRHLVGAKAAGPVLFDVLEAVADRSRPPQGTSAPRELTSIEVCAYSGHPPTEACPHTKPAYALTENVPTAPCPFHQQLEIDVERGLVVGPGCREGRTTETRSYVVWPATVRRWLADQHRHLPSPPEWAPECQVSRDRDPPTIVTPVEGQVSLLIPGIAPDDQEVPLQADAATPDARLSWYVDGEYLGTASVEGRVWWTPTPGRHVAVVMDEAGQTSRRVFEVRAAR